MIADPFGLLKKSFADESLCYFYTWTADFSIYWVLLYFIELVKEAHPNNALLIV